ncbi:MAG: membrane protein insertase YidC [Pseudomonadales bacterium]|jgi:YidC/Oxa1 family membrane protein insertase|nr:membrane protein insertase YidC [Pseudomonadales bacterium]MCP5337244.1 membrane protein insertase YidC [Pseudomonadales bacterium]
MDIQRNLIIVALILVSGFTLIEWMQYRADHTPAASVVTDAGTAPASLAPALDPAAIPTEVAPTNTGAPDLPGATPSAEAIAPTTTEAATTIRVVTDTLILDISLLGGDITRVALPQHSANIDRPDQPFVLMQQDPGAVYTAMSGLIGANGTDTAQGRPRFIAADARYELAAGQDTLAVDLRYEAVDGARITKRFVFHRGSYVVDMDYLIDNTGSQPWRGAMFAQLKRDGRPDPGASGGKLGVQPFIGFATHTADEPYRKFTFKDIAETPWQAANQGGWIALVQHYFIGAWIPSPEQTNSFAMLHTQNGDNIGRFTSPEIEIAPGTTGRFTSRFYAGPKDQYQLRQISPGLELTVDYGWLWWIAQPLFALLFFFATGQLHIAGWSVDLGAGLGNWGAAIVLLTVLVKAVFFHLSATSYKSMAKMRKLQPKMLELRDRYGDDRQKLSQETMELYRKEKVNPLGGCLPILIQMPVFLSLYWVLLESVELRHAPLALWIRDLSAMDPYFVLPLLMGASMYFQQKLNPPPPDPIQAKIFQFMPVIFTVFFLFFPAGLVLYWLVNNLLSMAQQWVITRQIERAP